MSLCRWHPRIIAVTGSVGKTTMLHLLEVQLGSRAHYSHFANSAFGVAFDIVGFRGITGSRLKWLWLFLAVPCKALFYSRKEEFYIVEIDGERPGEAEFLAKWLRPEVTLWISVAKSHAVYFDQQVSDGLYMSVEDAIAHEFSWLARNTQELVVIQSNNNLMTKYTRGIKATIKGVDDTSLKKYEIKAHQTKFSMTSGGFMFPYPMPRETYVQLAMLEKLAKYLNIPPKHDMATFVMPPGRSSYFEGKKGIKIIDSTYNAHLISMESAVKMVDAIQDPHTWLVIGDMIEQGVGEAVEHKRLAEVLADVVAERYILVGRRTYRYTAPVLKKLVKETQVVAFEHPSEALEYIEQTITGNELLLFKGSQYLEGIIEHLLANPTDSSLLCRRERVYQKRREAWGI